MKNADPDVTAQLYVMQWMHENGYEDALRALEKRVGRLYDDRQLSEASQLMQLVWRECEEQLRARQEDEDGEADTATASATPGGDPRAMAAVKRRVRQEEALRLLRAGCDDYAGTVVVAQSPAELHQSNVISVRIVPGEDCVITGAGDGYVRHIRLACRHAADSASASGGGGGTSDGSRSAETVWETRVGSAAVLSLALHPQYSSGLPLVAAGSMDGRVTVLHGPTGRIVLEAQPHTKYVVRVAWGQLNAGAASLAVVAGGAATIDGVGREGEEAEAGAGGAAVAAAPTPAAARALLLVSASNDETVGIHLVQYWQSDVANDGRAQQLGEEAQCMAQQGGGGGGGADGVPAGRLTTMKQVPYGAAVADASFLSDGRTLAVGVRGSNYLRLLDTAALLLQAGGAGGAASGVLPETLVNMNESGDDHVSFSPRQLLVSPCGRYLLVVTDSPHLLLLRTSDWSRLRLVFGLPVDNFPQPVAAWHRDSNYIYAAGANAQLCVFHVGTGRLVFSVRHHKINVRDLDYDPARNLLASCSFDKTVKLMGAKPRPLS